MGTDRHEHGPGPGADARWLFGALTLILTFMAGEVAVSTSSVFEVWIVVAAMYFVICFACARLFGVLERRLAVARGA